MSIKVVRVCNKCGKTMEEWDNALGLSLRKRIGYGSVHDGEYVDLDLCCECFDAIVDSCAFDPVKPEFESVGERE